VIPQPAVDKRPEVERASCGHVVSVRVDERPAAARHERSARALGAQLIVHPLGGNVLDGVVRDSQLGMHGIHRLMQLPRMGEIIVPRRLIAPAQQPSIVVEGHCVGSRDSILQLAPMGHGHSGHIRHNQERRAASAHLVREAAQEGPVRLDVAKARELGLEERDGEHVPRLYLPQERGLRILRPPRRVARDSQLVDGDTLGAAGTWIHRPAIHETHSVADCTERHRHVLPLERRGERRHERCGVRVACEEEDTRRAVSAPRRREARRMAGREALVGDACVEWLVQLEARVAQGAEGVSAVLEGCVFVDVGAFKEAGGRCVTLGHVRLGSGSVLRAAVGARAAPAGEG